jgi:hypothetical protein
MAIFSARTISGIPISTSGTLAVLNNICQEAVTKTDYDGDGRVDSAVFRAGVCSRFAKREQ